MKLLLFMHDILINKFISFRSARQHPTKEHDAASRPLNSPADFNVLILYAAGKDRL